MKKFYIFQKLVYLFLYFFLFFLFLHPVGGDGDYYHHLTAGKYIVTHHAFPFDDSFTFTTPGKDWINHSWLGGVTFYLLDSTFGPLGVSVFVSLVAVLTLLLLTSLLKSYRLPNSVTFPIVILSAAVLSTRWPSRPEIFAYPLVISILLIERLRERKPKLVLFYPLIILLWANLYGVSVLVGVILLAALMVRRFLADRFKILRSQWFFYISGIISLPLSLLNGYGVKSLFYIYYIREIGQKEMEWYGALKILTNAPYVYMLSFQYRFLIYLLFFGLIAVLAVINFKKLKNIPLETLLALSIFTPLFAFRQFPLAGVLSAPFLGLGFLALINTPFKKIANVSLFVIAGFAVAIAIWVNPPHIVSPGDYPAGLVPFIKNHSLQGNALNHPQDGGYLSYRLYPNIKIFADTRDELYLGTTIMEDYFGAIAEKRVLQVLEKYKVDIVIGDLSQGDAFKALFYSDTWAPVYIGGHYFVAVPRNIAQEKQIQTLDFLDPFSFSQAKEGREEEVLAFYEKLLKEDRATNDDKLAYSHALYSTKQYAKAIEILTGMKNSFGVRNVLFDMGKDYLTALSYLNLGNCTKAKEFLDKTNQGIKGAMLLTPSKKMPSPVARGYQIYNQTCTSGQIKLL